MTNNQFHLIKDAIIEYESLVPPGSHKGTLQSCRRHGWLTEKAFKQDADGDWYAVTKAGLEAACDYQFLHVYDAVDDNIFLRQIWISHF